jgi:hypothetical protein
MCVCVIVALISSSTTCCIKSSYCWGKYFAKSPFSMLSFTHTKSTSKTNKLRARHNNEEAVKVQNPLADVGAQRQCL